MCVQGELVRLEAVKGGALALDNPDTTIDDAMAAAAGLRGGSGNGLQSLHGNTMQDAPLEDAPTAAAADDAADDAE